MKLGPDLAGFYTKRGDYEVVRRRAHSPGRFSRETLHIADAPIKTPPLQEYMNKAETGLDSVVFYPEDSEQDRALKTALIEVYNRRLLRRIQRRALAEAFGINNPQVMAGKRDVDSLDGVPAACAAASKLSFFFLRCQP